MTKIPVISPGSTQVTKQTSQVQKKFTSGMGENLQAIGGTVAKVANEQYARLTEARDYKEVKEGQLKSLQTQRVLSEKARLDVDNKGDFTEYNEILARSKEETLKGFSDKAVGERFAASLDLENEKLRVSLNNQFIKHQINNGVAAIEGNVSEKRASYASTGDEKFLDEIDAEYEEGRKKGFYNSVDAQSFKISQKLKARNERFLTDLSNSDINAVEERLANNSYGLDLDQLKKAKSLFATEKTRIESQKKDELGQMFFDEELTDVVIDAYVENKWVPAADGTKMKKALRATGRGRLDPFVFTSMTERAAQVANISGFWANRSTEDRQEEFRESAKLVADIFEERGKGNLTKDEATGLLNKIKDGFEDFKPYREGISELQNFADKNYTPKQKDEVKRAMYHSFMSLVENGTDPVQAIELAKAGLYPEFDFNSLVGTAQESGLTIEQTVDLLRRLAKEPK